MEGSHEKHVKDFIGSNLILCKTAEVPLIEVYMAFLSKSSIIIYQEKFIKILDEVLLSKHVIKQLVVEQIENLKATNANSSSVDNTINNSKLLETIENLTNERNKFQQENEAYLESNNKLIADIDELKKAIISFKEKYNKAKEEQSSMISAEYLKEYKSEVFKKSQELTKANEVTKHENVLLKEELDAQTSRFHCQIQHLEEEKEEMQKLLRELKNEGSEKVSKLKSATNPSKKTISNDTVTSSNVSDKVVQKVKVVDDEKISREITCMSEEKLKSTLVEVSDKAVSGKSKEKADPKLKEGNISLGNEKKKKEIGRAAKSAYMDVEASGSSSLSGGPPKAKIRKLLSERFSSINIDTGLLH